MICTSTKTEGPFIGERTQITYLILINPLLIIKLMVMRLVKTHNRFEGMNRLEESILTVRLDAMRLSNQHSGEPAIKNMLPIIIICLLSKNIKIITRMRLMTRMAIK